jgi:hypothetical protein
LLLFDHPLRSITNSKILTGNPFCKAVKDREEGDYLVMWEDGGKKSLHSWICNTKSGKSLVFVFTCAAVLQVKM